MGHAKLLTWDYGKPDLLEVKKFLGLIILIMTSLDDVWLVQWLPSELVHLIHDWLLIISLLCVLLWLAIGNLRLFSLFN